MRGTTWWRTHTSSRRRSSERPAFRPQIEVLEVRDNPAAFTPGNLVIYRVGNGTPGGFANTGAAVFLDEYTPAGAFVQSIALPTTASGANRPLIANGTQNTEGLLTRSGNGFYLVLTGYARDVTITELLTNSSSADVNRVVGLVDNKAKIDTTTALTDFASNNTPRGAFSPNGTDIWVAGASGGVRYTTLGATTSTQLSTTVSNLRGVGIFDGQLYTSTASGSTVGIGTVGTGTPTTSGQTITNLAGFPTTGSPYGFFLADLSATVPGVDTLYVADDGGGGTGGLAKYSLVGGNWTFNGAVGGDADDYRGLTAVVSGTTVTLYATRKGGGTTAGGEFVSLVDSSGHNGSIVGLTPTLRASAGANTSFRGIALAPIPTVQPVNTLPPSFGGTEDQALALTGISAADPDVGGADVTVTFTVARGTLAVRTDVPGGVVSGEVEDNGTGTVVLTAPLTAVNTTLAATNGLVFSPAANDNGPVTLTMSTEAQGDTDTDNSTITLVAVNDAPVINLPTTGPSTNQNELVAITGLSITDVDAVSGTVSVVLDVSDGSLTVSITVSGGLTAGQVTGNASGLVTLTATLDQINTTLADAAGLTYTPATGFFGTATLTLLTNDLGNIGSGGQQSDTDSLSITVIQTDVNDTPINTLPATATTAANTPVSLTGISVSDDAGAGLITVTFTLSSGSLAVDTAVAGGVSLAEVSGNNSGLVTLTSTLAQINATLAASNGLVYTPAPGFSGTATLTMTINDLGNTGTGGAKLDTDTQTITVTSTAPNQPPVNTLPPTAPTSAGSPLSLTDISVADPDAGTALISVAFGVTGGILSVDTDVPGGVSPGEVLGNHSVLVIVTSTLDQINATLAAQGGLVYTPATGFDGTATLSMTSNDLGNSGSGGPLSDSDTQTITVTPAPVKVFATGSDRGNVGTVSVFEQATGDKLLGFRPYGDAFSGGVSVALGDSDADGLADFIVTAPGKSATQITEIRVFDLGGNRLTANPLDGTTPFVPGFKGGANLALGNLGGSALDLVVAPRSGRPDLVVINGADGTPLLSSPLSGIKPFGGKFKGSINVTVGDVDPGAPGLELVVAPGGGTVARVRVYSSTSITGAPLRTITFKGTSTVGLSVATAQLDAGPGEEIVVSALTGAPLIKIFSGSSGALLALHNKAGLGFAAGYKQGARVAVADTDEDGRFELLLAPGAGAVPSLRVLELGATLGAPPTELFSVLAQDAFTGFTVATL